MKKFLLTVIALGIAGLAGIGAFTVAEIAYRASGNITLTHRGAIIDVSLFRYRPYVVSTHPADLILGKSDHILEAYYAKKGCTLDGVAYRSNSLGFRSPEFVGLAAKKTNELRIVLTGGSAAISWGIGEACTLDRQLTKILSDAFPDKDIRVFNLGNGTWKSFQELIAVQRWGLAIDPDFIVDFSGYNDVAHSAHMTVNRAYAAGINEQAFKMYEGHVKGGVANFLEQFRVAKLPGELLKPRAVLGETPAAPPDDPERAVAPAAGKVFTRFSLPIDRAAIEKRTDFDPYNRQVVDNYVTNQRLLARAAALRGAVFISALQPTLYLKDPLSTQEKDHLLGGYRRTGNFVIQAYLRIRRALRETERDEANLIFLDLSEAFSPSPEQFILDDVHFTAEGYEIVARRIGEVIRWSVAEKAQ